MPRKLSKGFTLAELLIALAILGLIATFVIPKILSAQQNNKSNAMAKEVAAMVTGAYQKAQLAGTVTTSTKMADLTPYMNYVAVDTTSTINDRPGWGNQSCTSASWLCLRMHNGGILWMGPATPTFGGTTANNMIWANFDPDGATNQVNSGVAFGLYYNGQIMTFQDLKAGTVNSGGAVAAEAGSNPSWFSW